MKKLTTIIAAVALFCATAANAQEAKDEEPYNFVGLQVGAQATLTHYSIGKLITPQFAAQFGRYFNDKVGARVHLMGYQNKGGFKGTRFNYSTDKGYKFKACTADLDLLMNMTNIINPTRQNRAFDWVMLTGVGVNYGWDFDEYNNIADVAEARPDFTAYNAYYPQTCGTKHSSFNVRIGTQFNYNINEAWQVGLEIQANDKNDCYNLKINNKTDWQICALLGVTYKLGKCTKKAPVVAEPVYATRVDTVWYEDTKDIARYDETEIPEQIQRDIHYAICQHEPIDPVKVKAVADFVKSHKDVKVTVTGYADKGTGNPTINMRYSKERAEAVADALREAGVDADIMYVDWKGDTVQPFAENDANRVAITVASGIRVEKKAIPTKKFRTEEVRYQVK